jgi:hypothetical protein
MIVGLSISLVVVVGAAALVMFDRPGPVAGLGRVFPYPPPNNLAFVDSANTSAAIDAAKNTAERMFSIGYRSFDQDIARATPLLTGAALAKYQRLIAELRGPTVAAHLNVTSMVINNGLLSLAQNGTGQRATALVVLRLAGHHQDTGKTDYDVQMLQLAEQRNNKGDWRVSDIADQPGSAIPAVPPMDPLPLSVPGLAADIATQRDIVLATAEHDAVTLVNLDYRSAQQSLNSWLAVSTGTLYSDIAGKQASEISRAQADQSVATGVVQAGAVSVLGLDAGTATVLVIARVTASEHGAAPTTAYIPMEISMTRTSSGIGWQASDMYVPPPNA